MSAATDDGDWPHDPDGEEGSEGGRKYGMAIVAKSLHDDLLGMIREHDDLDLDEEDLHP